MEFKSVNKIFEESIKKNWLRPAISNYQGETLHFRDLARRIEKLHIMFEECGLEKGDKVAICSVLSLPRAQKSCWAVIHFFFCRYCRASSKASASQIVFRNTDSSA